MGLTWGTWGLYLKKHVHSWYTANWVFLFRPSGAQNHMRNIWELALRFGCISSQGEMQIYAKILRQAAYLGATETKKQPPNRRSFL